MTFKLTRHQTGGKYKVCFSVLSGKFAISFCVCNANNVLNIRVSLCILGNIKRCSKPIQERFDSDWIFLLILGIVVALISFGLDFSIDKCQQGKCLS